MTSSERHGPLRERILAGAALAFGRLGYARTRVEDVLEATGISRPTFYKVFASKDDVFEQLSARHHADIERRVEAAYAEGKTPTERVLFTLQAYLRWRVALGPLGRALDLEARTPGSRLAAQREKTLEALVELGQRGLRAAGRPQADPIVFRALIAAAEQVADLLLSGPSPGEAELTRALAVVARVHGATLGQAGDAIPPLPLRRERPRAARAQASSRRRKRRATR